MRKSILAAATTAALFAAATLAAASAARADADRLDPLGFIDGRWHWAGAADKPDTSVIRRDLEAHVLVRHDRIRVSPSRVIDAEMTFYAEGERLRGDYFDSAGQIVHYRAVAIEPGKLARFLSEPTSSGAVYRLTYEPAGEDLIVRVERAEAAHPDVFRPVSEHRMQRE